MAPLPYRGPTSQQAGQTTPAATPETDYSKELGPSNALPGQNYFSPTVDSSLIPGELSRDIPGILNHGLLGKTDAGSLGAGMPGQGMPGSQDPMAEALANRYSGQTQNEVRAITAHNEEQAPVLQSQQESTVTGQLGAEYANTVQNFNQQYSYEMNRLNLYNQWKTAQAQAQASLYGAVFGGIGSFAGTILGTAAGKKGGGGNSGGGS